MSSSSFVGRPTFYILIFALVLAVGGVFGLIYYNVSNPYIRGDGNIDAASIQEIDIHWQQGEVRIQIGDTDHIQISETGAETQDHKVIFRAHEGELTVKYCMPKILHPSSGDLPKKDLTVTVPADKSDLIQIQLYGEGATFYLQDIKVSNLSAEGNDNCHFFFEGALDQLDIHLLDSNFTGNFNNAPKVFNISSSAKLSTVLIDFTLPSDVGFIYDAGYPVKTAQMVKGIYENDKYPNIATKYYYGDQGLQINIDPHSRFSTLHIHGGPPIGHE